MENLTSFTTVSDLGFCNSIDTTANCEACKALFIQDQALLHGKLSNGLTYFIKENPFDTKKASLRLFVKIGSIHEMEQERGLAHFIEHMVFRGSDHFKDGEVIKFLEAIGAAFGAHTNAYTSFDETSYMLDIPVDNLENLDMGLKILSDFAFKAHFGQKELDIEKGVVLDEMRQREAHSRGRLSNLLCEQILGHTPYGARLPIGKEEVIKSCTSEKMHAFYSRWYHPQNMAVIAVGDFSSNLVLDKLKNYFENEIRYEHPPHFSCPSIDNTRQDVAIINNPDNMSSSMIFSSWIDNEDKTSTAGYKISLIDNLVALMVNRRFSILAEQENAPFSLAYMMYPNFVQPKRSLMIHASCWDKRPQDALEGVMTELEKIRQLSFEQSELVLAKNTLKTLLKQILQNANCQLNAQIAFKLIQTFKFDFLALSTQSAAELEGILLENISLEEVNLRKDTLLLPEFFSVTYFPSEAAEIISVENMRQIIEKMRSKEFTKNQQELKTLDLLVQEKPGDILSETLADTTHVEQIKLSNHMQVLLLHSDVKKNMFQVYLQASGGLDHTNQDLLPSAKVASDYLYKSGLYGLSSTELADVLSGKNVKCFSYASLSERKVTAATSQEDMLYLFKMIHGLFTFRNFNERAWKQTMEENDQRLALKESNSELQFYQLQNEHNYCNHYAFKLYTSKDMDQQKAHLYLDKVFANPKDYTMIIVGDYDKPALLHALKTYIASIPYQGEFLEKEFAQFDFPSDITAACIETTSLKDECTIVVTFPLKSQSMGERFEEYFYLELIKNLLTRRCIESLRMQEGQTYGVHLATFFPFYPKPTSGRLLLYFSCQKDQELMMRNLLLEELKKALQSPFSQEEVEKAFEIYKHEYAKSLLTLEGLHEIILQNVVFKQPLTCFIQDKVLEKIPSYQKLQTFLADLIDLNHYSVCVRRPKGS